MKTVYDLLEKQRERVKQDPDVGDKKGTQPDVYYKGLKKSTKDKRDAHFKKHAKMDDDNPAAYKPAPGDATAKTKPSKHTKKFQKMFGEEMKSSDRSYLEKRHKMLDQLQDKIIRMRDLDRDLKNKANKAVGQARFAIEDLLDADEMNEKLDANSDAGDYIDDFRKSDAPQFKGKSDKKIRQMAIAAYLDKKDGK